MDGARDTLQSPEQSFLPFDLPISGHWCSPTSVGSAVGSSILSCECSICCVVFLRILSGCGVSAGLSSSSWHVKTRPYVTICSCTDM